MKPVKRGWSTCRICGGWKVHGYHAVQCQRTKRTKLKDWPAEGKRGMLYIDHTGWKPDEGNAR